MGATFSIDIHDYLNADEIHDICVNELRRELRSQMRQESDVERVISNLTYAEAQAMVENALGIDLTEELKDHIAKVIREDDSTLKFHIFREEDAWGNHDGPGTKIIDEEVEACRPLIRRKIEELIEGYDFRWSIEDVMMEALERILEEKLFTKGKDGSDEQQGGETQGRKGAGEG